MNDPQASTSTPMLTEIVLPGLVGPESLSINQRPVPTPGKGQALVEVLATGVSFAEQQMRRGRYPGQPKFPNESQGARRLADSGCGGRRQVSTCGSRALSPEERPCPCR